MGSRRVQVMKEGGEPKLLNLTDGMSFHDFLSAAGQKVGVMNPKKAFLDGKLEVDDLDVVRDNDTIVIFNDSNLKARKKAAGPQTFRIAVMGPGSVGKSALTLQYVQGRFISHYDPTIEDAYRKQTVIDGGACFLDILDTAGQEDYVALRGQWMQERQGFVLVFAIDDKRSFEEIQAFHDQLLQVHEDGIPVVLVGNKSDLDESRQVSKFEAEQLAKVLKVPFVEASAKTAHNVEKVFSTLVRDIRSGLAPPKRTVCNIL